MASVLQEKLNKCIAFLHPLNSCIICILFYLNFSKRLDLFMAAMSTCSYSKSLLYFERMQLYYTFVPCLRNYLLPVVILDMGYQLHFRP